MSANAAHALADFIHDTGFEDIPADVVDYTKLVILDSLICGIAAGPMERSRMMHSVVGGLGGAEESTVFGMAGKAPAVHAAMANAEIMNLLDADDTFFSSSHFAVFNVAAAWAEAERLGRSGREVIRSVALGFDVNARMNLAQLVMDEVDGVFRWSPIQGMGFAAYGTGASAATAAGLDREQMRNLFGLLSWMAPTPTATNMSSRREFGSMKYANYGGAAQAGMMAARFAEQGYSGDQDCLDTEPGFMHAQGTLRIDRELLLDELAEKWWIMETALKYYPSCRYTHGPIDMIRKVMAENALTADDIEEIEVRLNPMAFALSFFRDPPTRIEPDHRAPLHGAFNIPYVMALVALGRTPGPQWYGRENLEDPAVWEMAARVRTAVDEDAKDEIVRAFRETSIRRFRKTRGAMTVRAGGREHVCESDYCEGDPWSPATRPTWERIAQKGHEFCDAAIGAARVDELVERVRALETTSDVGREVPLA